MADDVTIGELVWRLEQLRKDISDDFAQVRKDIADDRNRFVSLERYNAESTARDGKIAAVNERINTGVKWALGILGTIVGLQLWQWLQLKQAVKP